jgi:hypothetical protein
MKKEMTRQELITRIASDYGYGPAVSEQFSTEILRRALYSSIGACNYVTTLLKIEYKE